MDSSLAASAWPTPHLLMPSLDTRVIGHPRMPLDDMWYRLYMYRLYMESSGLAVDMPESPIDLRTAIIIFYCPISLLNARVSQVFLNTCMRVCGGIGSGVFFSLFLVSTCCWCRRLCFGRSRDRGFVLYISLFLRVLGWCVCVCLYTCVHTHKPLGYLMCAQVRDGHLESQENPDRLKCNIHVDRIGVQNTSDYIYAGLRVLMI